MLAAQDFCHTVQKEDESVADFTQHLERTFCIAYSKDAMSVDTRDALLYGQLQEGLRYELMRAPSVSGAQNYNELCVAAKNEKRLAELRKRHQYLKTIPQSELDQSEMNKSQLMRRPFPGKKDSGTSLRKCWNCGSTKHLKYQCPQPEESGGRSKPPSANLVQSGDNQEELHQGSNNPLDFLYSSDSDDSSVNLIRVEDQGSAPRCVRVELQGVPAYGVVDSGADINIVNGTLFKKVAAVARLKKKDFRRADTVPRTYSQQHFKLDGRMDLDVTFGDKTMRTRVYVKMDAREPLLLSKRTCCQLGTISYHPAVDIWRGENSRRKVGRKSPNSNAKAPMVMVRSVRIPRTQGTVHLENRGSLGCPPEWVQKSPIAGEEQTKKQVAHRTATPDELLNQEGQCKPYSQKTCVLWRAPQKGGGDVTKYNVI